MTFDMKELNRLYKKLKEYDPSSKAHEVYQSSIEAIEAIVKR